MCFRGSYQNFLQRVKEQHKDSEWWVESTFFFGPDHVSVGSLSKGLWLLHTRLLKRVYSQTHIAIVKPVLSGPVLGTVHFYQVGGTGGIWSEGGWGWAWKKKKMALKGGSKEFKFCSDGICNNANSQPAFLTFKRVQIFPGKHACPQTPCFMYMYSHTKVLHFFTAVSSILIPRVHALECRTMVEM